MQRWFPSALILAALLAVVSPARADDKRTPPAVTGSPPPWSAGAHAHYLAVTYGRSPSHVAIFAPGRTVPSAVLDFSACCAAAVAFDAAGVLYVATTGDGIAIFPPGATTPSRRLPTGGTALAIDTAGDVAAGGGDGDGSVHVYPAGGENGAYTLPGRVAAGGLAFAPNGELAVADGSATVSVYAPNAAEPTRSYVALPETNLVLFDAAGRLVVASTSFGHVKMLAPAPGVGSIEFSNPDVRPEALAFDAAGRMLIGFPGGIKPLARSTWRPGMPLSGAAANVLASDQHGAFAAGDGKRGVVLIYASGPRTVLRGLDGVRCLAFSP